MSIIYKLLPKYSESIVGAVYRQLSAIKDYFLAEDIRHYKKIIATLKRTKKLMAEIDQIVEF